MSDDNRTAETLKEGAASLQAAGDAARQIGAHARDAGAQAADQAKGLAQDARQQGAALAGAVGDKVAATASAQKDSLADRLEDVAHAVHRSGEQLEGHQDFIAHLVERGAAELSVLATTLRTNDLNGLMGGLQDLARRQPALFAGASLAAGFALSRVGRLAIAGASKADLPSLSGGQHERE